jgi:hypothetical protein
MPAYSGKIFSPTHIDVPLSPAPHKKSTSKHYKKPHICPRNADQMWQGCSFVTDISFPLMKSDFKKY